MVLSWWFLWIQDKVWITTICVSAAIRLYWPDTLALGHGEKLDHQCTFPVYYSCTFARLATPLLSSVHSMHIHISLVSVKDQYSDFVSNAFKSNKKTIKPHHVLYVLSPLCFVYFLIVSKAGSNNHYLFHFSILTISHRVLLQITKLKIIILQQIIPATKSRYVYFVKGYNIIIIWNKIYTFVIFTMKTMKC